MTTYYYNTNPDKKGNHTIHTDDCKYLPIPKNRKMIGRHKDGNEALRVVCYRTYENNFTGCYYCCPECR